MVIGPHSIPNTLKFFLQLIELRSYLRSEVVVTSRSQVFDEKENLRENLILNVSFFGWYKLSKQTFAAAIPREK